MEEISGQNSDLALQDLDKLDVKSSGGKYEESYFMGNQKIHNMVQKMKAEVQVKFYAEVKVAKHSF